LLYLKSEGKLPLPFVKRTPSLAGGNGSRANWQQIKSAPATPPMLDAKGRAVPPDVKAMVARMKQTQKDA
jgi:hypothetical protein